MNPNQSSSPLFEDAKKIVREHVALHESVETPQIVPMDDSALSREVAAKGLVRTGFEVQAQPLSRVETQPLAIAHGDTEIGRLLDKAMDRNIDAASMEKLVALYERVSATKSRDAFNVAKAAFQEECPPVYKVRQSGKGADRGGFTFLYATRADILKVVRPILVKHGFSVGFSIEADPDGKPWRVCKLNHREGHSESSRFPYTEDTSGKMQGIQKAGSGSEYSARYALLDVLGLCTQEDDDDGASTGDPDAVLSENQRRTINDLFIELKLDDAGKAAFLGIFEVKSVAEIKAVMFGPVTNALNARIKGLRR